MTLEGRNYDPRMVILSDQDVLIGGRTATPTSWTWRTPKDPVSVVARQVEFGRILRGRTIARLLVGSAGVDVVAQGVVGSLVTLVLRGGVDQVAGRVELRATCTDGTDEVAAVLQPMQAQITLVPEVVVPVSLALGGPVTYLLANGSTQADAQPITAPISVFTGGPAGSGGILAGTAGVQCVVVNRIGSPLLIYPPANGTIEGQAANMPETIVAAGSATFTSLDGKAWFAF